MQIKRAFRLGSVDSGRGEDVAFPKPQFEKGRQIEFRVADSQLPSDASPMGLDGMFRQVE